MEQLSEKNAFILKSEFLEKYFTLILEIIS